MANSAIAQLTRGDGGSHGDGDDDDRFDTESLPSNAPTNASAYPGDMDLGPAAHAIIKRPDWSGSQECSDGCWATAETRGGGETSGDINAEAEDAKGNEHVGNFGLFNGNWGGNWENPGLQRHMLHDMKSTPAHLLCLQEAEEVVLTHLKKNCRSRCIRGDGGQARQPVHRSSR